MKHENSTISAFESQCAHYENLLSPGPGSTNMNKLLSPKNISSNHLFIGFFSKNVAFTKLLPK